jgi:hypothetical protein
MPAPSSRGYVAGQANERLRDVTAVNPAVPWMAGDMISTVEDLGVYARALARSDLLKPSASASASS